MVWALKGVSVTDKILVIDDDPNVAELIKLILKPRGLLTYHAINGQEGLKQAYELQPDLIILDVMMPERDGYEICARLREFTNVPIIMLTAKSQSSDLTRGFAVGADDYVKKPFSNDELISRIESLLRRKKSTDVNAKITGYTDGFLEIDFNSQKVTLQGEEIDLTPTEFKLLAFLIRHPHKTLSNRTLLNEVWGDAYIHAKALLSLYIYQLRQKLNESERDHKYIQTQWGQGYWFNPLPQVKKPSLESVPVDPEQTKQESKVETSPKFRWTWFILVIPILLLALQLDMVSSVISTSSEGSTSIHANVAAESFIADDFTGVRGNVCVSNQGKYPTENLSIVVTVQTMGERQGTLTSKAIDLGDHTIINPDESHCYPYEVGFTPLLGEIKYRNFISITITNYSGLEIGSQYCPGPGSCAFGPTITTDFSFSFSAP